jgi:putative transposase
MYRAYSIRLQPNAAQRAKLGLYLERLRELYNMALEQRRDAWKTSKKSLGYYAQCLGLSELRTHPDYEKIPNHVCKGALYRLDRAFRSFYARASAGQSPGYPRFKKEGDYRSFDLPDSKDFWVKGNRVSILGLGPMRFRAHREVQGKPKQIIVVCKGGRWEARVVCDIGPAPAKRVVERAVGIDVGLTTLATLSDGMEIENPRWTKRCEDKIAKASRNLARKKRGSKNRLKAKEALRRAHQRAANLRSNYLHHVSKWLVANYDLIAYEKLNIGAMAHGRLAKSIMDAAWGQLLYDLNYKAEEAGVHVIAVNPSGTSQRCSGCGATVKKTLAEREHRCECGLTLGRDHNAALNILTLGRSVVAQAAKA